MNMRTQSNALPNALRALIPHADISILHARPWHSLTFSGTQMCLSVHINDGKSLADADEWSRLLSEHEFKLPRQLVADIAVTRALVAKGAQCLIIDALLIDS
jgi:hypothetical protein